MGVSDVAVACHQLKGGCPFEESVFRDVQEKFGLPLVQLLQRCMNLKQEDRPNIDQVCEGLGVISLPRGIRNSRTNCISL